MICPKESGGCGHELVITYENEDENQDSIDPYYHIRCKEWITCDDQPREDEYHEGEPGPCNHAQAMWDALVEKKEQDALHISGDMEDRISRVTRERDQALEEQDGSEAFRLQVELSAKLRTRVQELEAVMNEAFLVLKRDGRYDVIAILSKGFDNQAVHEASQ